jgi:hypothetical protein
LRDIFGIGEIGLVGHEPPLNETKDARPDRSEVGVILAFRAAFPTHRKHGDIVRPPREEKNISRV